MISANFRLLVICVSICFLLLVPLVAMQFTSEVYWTLSDFIVMGSLLLLTGLACEVVLRKVKSRRSRLMMCGAVLVVFLLIWAELAVGVFGTPFAGS